MEKCRKILLIDDSEVIASFVTEVLQTAGFTVVHAVNGLQGIEKTYQEIPDAIIMDVEMPLMDGFQATRLLKATRGFKDIPIIMHTTLSDAHDRNWATQCGADAFFVKDLTQMETLLQAVTSWSDHAPYPLLPVMQEESGTITQEQIISMAGNHFDRTLFHFALTNQLIQVNRHITSLEKTAAEIFNTLQNSCEFDVALVALRYHKQTLVFALPKERMLHSDLKDFTSVCLNDYYERFAALSQEPLVETILGIEYKSNFMTLRLDKEKIRSYLFFELKDARETIIGTIHLGHFTNNYFTDKLSQNIQALIPTIALLFSNALYLRNVIEKEQKIRGVFAKFVPPQIIDSLLEKQDAASLLIGEKRGIAVLFSDIRSFTSISENNSAEDVVSCLNNYFDLMAQAIKTEGGIIDKFIGDAILAVFGAPTSYEDNAQRAVRAAIGMIQTLNKLDTSRLKLPQKGFQIGIGIHDGIAIVGNIGSKEKFDYTVIGDTVNLAARLEGLTKHYSQQIIISEAVKAKIGDNFFVRELDNVKVKGKEQATAMYSIPIATRAYFTPDVVRDYQKGISMYKMKNWLTAIEYFQKVATQIPDDPICDMYIERCQKFIKQPPEADWDGAIELDFK